MTVETQPITLPPFPHDYRASGVLLPVTSLPSPYGIGDMGPAAFAWIDQLADAGQCCWQALPFGPTGYGDSPYQALSSFASNGLLISPELLFKDGLLQEKTCKDTPSPSTDIDYGQVTQFKHQLLDHIWNSFRAGARRDLRAPYERFCFLQAHWLEDYALFRALKEKYPGISYNEWPAELVQRDGTAIAKARRELSKLVDKVRFSQFLISRQAQQLKEYAHSRGVGLIGDLPFFVSPDSCDVWSHAELFMLDEGSRPRFVAGVPPDYFSENGQLWGNPVYDWNALRRTGFQFYIDRLRALLNYVDVIRLDHFRAFASAWHVPAGARTARTGHWVPGPRAEFFHAVRKQLGTLPFIAEDLGLITPDVCALRDEFQIPGTKVLQFAFDGSPDNPHLPANYSTNMVVYTGTHDNNTTRGWFEALSDSGREKIRSYLNRPDCGSAEIAGELIGMAWCSAAALAITPLQDLLNLGSESRTNLPGSSTGNWSWRAPQQLLDGSTSKRLRNLTASSKRAREPESSLAARAESVGA
jgi:4-alpha-glucanotransferase